MDHKSDEYWGIVLLGMAQDAKEDGDVGTAELLTAAAARCFDDADRLAMRWRKLEPRLDDESSRRPKEAALGEGS